MCDGLSALKAAKTTCAQKKKKKEKRNRKKRKRERGRRKRKENLSATHSGVLETVSR